MPYKVLLICLISQLFDFASTENFDPNTSIIILCNSKCPVLPLMA